MAVCKKILLTNRSSSPRSNGQPIEEVEIILNRINERLKMIADIYCKHFESLGLGQQYRYFDIIKIELCQHGY